MLSHSLSAHQVLKELNSSYEGLGEVGVKKLQQTHGPNQLKQTDGISPLKIFLRQFASFLVFLLFGASLLSFLIGEEIDAVVILAVLALNAAIGFVQEYKAEEALAKLKKMETPLAIVLREGEEKEINATELVPGDVVMLREGGRVPADGRLLDTFSLEIDESMLTGESRAVAKSTKELPENTPLAERINLGFAGTVVARGKGKMVVTAIGMATEMGKIATLVQKVESTPTPLQISLEKIGHLMGIVGVAIALPALAIGVYVGRDWAELVITAIALAVSSIPEGLPIVVTVALAFGVRRMVKKQVLIRRLNAVEALGSTDVICVDKTGTITQNMMEVSHVFTFDLGNLKYQGNLGTIKKNAGDLVEAAMLCNDATLKIGDPTEKALVSFAYDLGLTTKLRRDWPRINESPFSSENKYMLTLNQRGTSKVAIAKGAPEKILTFCHLAKADKLRVLVAIEEMSSQGMRLLAFASKKVNGDHQFGRLENYQFLGLVGIFDPPRKSVKPAIAACHQAGIRVIMITGDHPLTAQVIANEVGIISDNLVTGQELDSFSAERMKEVVKYTNIFARVSPEHKLQILAALQAQGHFVAMSGDGVNDAPALKEANIGVAVGSGSDLAKEVADMIILDDDFASIVKAIREGRGIFDNIKKVVTYIIAVNFDEVLIITSSLLFGLPLPFLPIHLLWLNLATDTLPSMALSIDTYSEVIMKRKPYDPTKEILKGIWQFSLIAAAVAFSASFGVYLLELFLFKSPVPMVQTMTFTVTVLFELLFIFVVRTHRRLKDSRPFANRWLLGAVMIGLILQLVAIYSPGAREIFKTVPLMPFDWLMLLPFATLGILVFELIRYWQCVIKKDPACQIE